MSKKFPTKKGFLVNSKTFDKQKCFLDRGLDRFKTRKNSLQNLPLKTLSVKK